MKKIFFSFSLFFMLLIPLYCYAEEVLVDNSGYILTEVYGDSVLESQYAGLEYYDCYIPYRKMLGEIGGFTVDVYGLSNASENNAVGDFYRYMKSSTRLKYVGEEVGYYFKSNSLQDYYYYSEKETGLFVYKDSGGNEYYGVSLPKFFFGEGSLIWSEELLGSRVDVILEDATVIHCVIDDLMWESQCNGWSSTSSLESNGFHTEVMYSQYTGLFDDVTGDIIKFVGNDSEGFEKKYNISQENRISYVRVYSSDISDYEERGSKGLDYKYSGKIVYTGSLEDEEVYSGGCISEEELGKGVIASKFTEETQKIVEAHCKDFDVTTLKSFMESHGGYVNYLKSLGGVFEKFAGDDVKIPVKTAGDYKIACEYVFGIICMWGFDYSNGDPGHYGRWRSGDGVSESKVTDDAFYPKGYNIPYEYKDKYAAPRDIDKIASQEDVKQKGVNTCCNFCVDLIRNKIELADFLTTSEGKQPGTCGIKTQRKLTEQLIGEPGIFKASDLKAGDLIHCYNHQLSASQKSDPNASISGWFHVLVVGEVDKEAGTLTLYETGHDLTNDGNYKNTVKIKNGLPYVGWLGTRWFNIDESTESTLGEFSAGNTSGSIGVAERVPLEEELDGMPEDFKISDNAKFISNAKYDDLSEKEKKEIQNIKVSLEENSFENKIIEKVRVLIAFTGLWLMLYGILLNVAFIFDKSNNFVDISLLSIVTLGVISKDDIDMQGSGMYGYSRILKISIVMLLVSIILVSGSVYLWMFKIFEFIMSIL